MKQLEVLLQTAYGGYNSYDYDYERWLTRV
jgi:hypothetical protein